MYQYIISCGKRAVHLDALYRKSRGGGKAYMRSLFGQKAILPDKPMTHLSPARNLYISDKTYLVYKPVSEAKYFGDRLTYLLQAKKKKIKRVSRIPH